MAALLLASSVAVVCARQFFAAQVLPHEIRHDDAALRDVDPRAPFVIDRALQLAAHYFVHASNEDGTFRYEVDESTGAVAVGRYNVLRHAGAAYAMLELYEVTKNERLRESAERAMRHLEAWVRPCPVRKGRELCVTEEGATKLGGNALALLALTKLADDGGTPSKDLLRGLAERIVHLQEENGAFRAHKQSVLDGRVHDFVSEYYPGEAVFALARLYALDRDARWLRAAMKGARYLVTVRDGGVDEEDLPYDHWLLHALRALSRYDDSAVFADHAERVVAAMDAAKVQWPALPGSAAWPDPPKATPTATRIEGLLAANALLRARGRYGAADRALALAESAARFLLTQQIDEAAARELPDPAAALGGFVGTPGGSTVRIDYVQHAVSALIDLQRALAVAAMTPAAQKSH